MQQKVNPVVAVALVVVVIAVVGFASYKFLGNTGGATAYVAGEAPKDLEKHVNAPPGIGMSGGKPAVAKTNTTNN